MVGDYYYGTGRRKSAVARVFLKPGKGGFVVNGKSVDEFFARAEASAGLVAGWVAGGFATASAGRRGIPCSSQRLAPAPARQ